MISYFIVAHCMFMTNFSSKLKLKSQFQVIFGQDSFPLKMSPFQVSLLHNFTKCLLTNGWWNTRFYHYPFFTKKFPISSPQALGLSEDISLLSNRQFLWSSLIMPWSSLMQIAPITMDTSKMELFVNI